VDEVEAFGRSALARIEAILTSHALSKGSRDRAQDARAFAKIAVLVLDAIDELNALGNDGAIPVGGAAGAGAQLAVTPDAGNALALSYHGYKVAGAAIAEDGVLVRAYGDAEAIAKLRVGMDRFGLVMEAFVGAASIAADMVEIRDELGENNTGGVVLASAKLGVDLAKVTLAFAKLEFRMAEKVAAKAAEKALVRATIVTAAVALIVDLAILYNDHNGNLSEMAEALVRPVSADGVLDLPFLVMGVVELTAAVYLFTLGATAAEIGATAGPLGAAAALFVLAALLVLNKETVACTLYGTICFSSLDAIRNGTGNAVQAMFNASAYANSFDLGMLALAARMSSASAASQWLSKILGLAGDPSGPQSLETSLRNRANHLSAVEQAIRNLRHGVFAAVEQLDDFASGPFVNSEGRASEGYAEHCTLTEGCIHFAGDVTVSKRVGETWDSLGRWRWRPLLATVQISELEQYSFGFTLTQTNAIDVKEYERWSGKANEAVQHVADAFEALVEEQKALAALP